MDVMDLIKRHEGLRLHPYLDSVGKCTIGYGRNLDDEGITQPEAEGLLEVDLSMVTVKCMSLNCWRDLDEVRQAVLIDVAFNVGYGGLLEFRQMLDALTKHDYATAARELLNSKAAIQLPNRYSELAQMMSSGLWPGA